METLTLSIIIYRDKREYVYMEQTLKNPILHNLSILINSFIDSIDKDLIVQMTSDYNYGFLGFKLITVRTSFTKKIKIYYKYGHSDYYAKDNSKLYDEIWGYNKWYINDKNYVEKIIREIHDKYIMIKNMEESAMPTQNLVDL